MPRDSGCHSGIEISKAGVDGLLEKGHILHLDAKWRADSQHVPVGAGLGCHQFVLAGKLEELVHLPSGRFLRCAVLHQFRCHHEAPDIADEVVLLFHVLQRLQHGRAHYPGIVDQSAFVDYAQHRPPCRAGYRVGPVGVEVELARHGLGDVALCHHCTQRESIADALGQDHDIGNDAVMLECPVSLPGATEARLDLVHDARASGGAYPLEGTLEISVRRGNDTAVTLDRFEEHASNTAAGAIVNGLVDGVEIGLDTFSMNTPVLVRVGDELDASQQRDRVAEIADPGY